MVKTATPKVVLATVGSLGDLHPFIALGRALRARGADVVIACALEYKPKIEAAGLKFCAVRPSFEDMQTRLNLDRAALTRAVLAQGAFLFRELVVPGVRVAYEDMLPLVADADLVLTSSLCFGARLACERCAVPWIGIVLQPMMFLSAFDMPVIPKAQWLSRVLRRLGAPATAIVLGMLKHAVGRLLRPIHALRREIGLAQSRQNPLFEGQFSAAGAIALYSEVLGGIRADYPQPTSIAGFAWFDSEDGTAPRLEPELLAFLAAGAAPLVFTLGSLVVHDPGSFYRESLAAARLLGMRAVLVGAPALALHGASPSDAAPDVFACEYAPHSLLFPRAAAITHQGGIGTLAQALRSGRPQLVVPFFADQLDNAARAVRLGVARSLAPSDYGAATAARELERLTTGEQARARARHLGARLLHEDGAAVAAELVMNRLNSRINQ
jgi:UDP:flavonoid glycosyltransferase YjiC (YdhE family)